MRQKKAWNLFQNQKPIIGSRFDMFRTIVIVFWGYLVVASRTL